MDSEHATLGAVWMPAGNWRRPEYYAVAGKSREEAIADEVRAVRTQVGMIDVGTLGKIEIHGPHAAEFLERVYTARFANLKVGMTRYGVMLDETGVVIDDGVIARLGPESFYFTTTTGNSATLFREFGRLATWWGLQVGLVNLTGHYAAFNLAGPAARAVLRQHTELDLSDGAFPYLGVREALVAGAPSRIMRVGFVGELGYEIHLPAEHAVDVWRALLASSPAPGLQPFGVEAQRMLRLEKGHIIVGQDTDGVTNALELDMPWALKMDKPFFVGQRSLQILEKQPRRQTLVGFTLPQPSPGEMQRRPKECHLVIEGTADRRPGDQCRVVAHPGSLYRSGTRDVPRSPPANSSGSESRRALRSPRILRGRRSTIPPASGSGWETRREALTPRRRVAEIPACGVGSGAGRSAARRSLPTVAVWLQGAGRGSSGSTAAGYRVPRDPNSAVLDSAGVLVARLATSEFLIEAVDGGSERVDATLRQLAAPARPANVYPVARQDLVVGIQGPGIQTLLRQICSVDFVPLFESCGPAAGPVCLTSMVGRWRRGLAAADRERLDSRALARPQLCTLLLDDAARSGARRRRYGHREQHMTPDEARKFFDEHQTRYVLAQFVDIHGAAKAKAVPVEHYDMVVGDGAGFAGFRGVGTGHGTARARTSWASATPTTSATCRGCRGLPASRATVTSTASRIPTDSRVTLKNQLRRFTERGYTLYTGIEPEFMLLQRTPDGKLAPFDRDRHRGQALLRLQGPGARQRHSRRSVAPSACCRCRRLSDRSRGRERPVRNQLHLRRCVEVRRQHDPVQDGRERDRQETRRHRDLHAQAVLEPDGHRRALSPVHRHEGQKNAFYDKSDKRGLGLSQLGYWFLGGLLRARARARRRFARPP